MKMPELAIVPGLIAHDGFRSSIEPKEIKALIVGQLAIHKYPEVKNGKVVLSPRYIMVSHVPSLPLHFDDWIPNRVYQHRKIDAVLQDAAEWAVKVQEALPEFFAAISGGFAAAKAAGLIKDADIVAAQKIALAL